ncbi:hypothetical protein [Hyphobacterium marinum]|uniref:DUF885 domain-containing protein n=1 Tax=Hyphobacterium marinum TaxID=3116574 RepID=A0ABU7LW89_9PROT|nr:hypothetical protein [Hyphobacterium sp. Y6023]MEE2565245.1 hypothetical protein [Hyphobacterium sp. Y6023]
MLRLAALVIFVFGNVEAAAQQYDWQDYQSELSWSGELSYTISDFADQLSDRWQIAQEGYLLEAGDITEAEASATIADIIEQRERMYAEFTAQIEFLLEQEPSTGDARLDSGIDAVASASRMFLVEAEQAFALDARMAEHFRSFPEELERQDAAANLTTARTAADVYLANSRLWLLFTDDQQFLHRGLIADIEFTECQNRLRAIEAVFQTGNVEQVPVLASELRDHAERLNRLSRSYGNFASMTATRWRSELNEDNDRPDQHQASIELAEAYAELFEAYEATAPLFMSMMSISRQATGLDEFLGHMDEPQAEFFDAFQAISRTSSAVDDAQARLDAFYE